METFNGLAEVTATVSTSGADAMAGWIVGIKVTRSIAPIRVNKFFFFLSSAWLD